MALYYNGKEEFGWGGPFEAASKEELADGMEPSFREWAKEEINRGSTASVDEIMAQLRVEYIEGLELVNE